MSAEHAKVAAISFEHCASVARLLRAHGREAEARQLESALETAVGLVAVAVGERALTQAMTWVSEQVWSGKTFTPPPA